ncbi:MAG TPA: phosphoribosyltransferase family protein [Acidimicrobiia bacterium]|nr:phosphoribosyltransferase family protein [Acidimicrobiia bacterium]
MNPWRAFVEALFPALCPGCGRPAEPVCPACARTLRAPPALPPPAGVDRWMAPFAYEGVARELVARVKYARTRATVPWLASCMSRLVAAARAHTAVGLVTWTPTTASRRRARGFDHAEVLARAVARELGLPVGPTLRRRPGPPQTGRPAAARRAGPQFDARPGAFQGRVLLVDDVATTGATIAAAAGALRRAGVTSVIAVTAARTPRPGTAPRVFSKNPAYTRPMAAGSRRENAGIP